MKYPFTGNALKFGENIDAAEMLLMAIFSLMQYAEEEEIWSFKAVSSLFPLKYGKFKHQPSHRY